MNYPSLYRDRNSLAEILAQLKTQIDPALLTKKEGEEEDENKKTGGEGKVIWTRLVTSIMSYAICFLLFTQTFL